MPRHHDGAEGEAIDGNAPSAWDEVFARERAAIREPDGQHQGPDRPLTGLAFSGGGIRSATFNLGILQALAELRLLRHFDYLSCVSGGGYIGGWLSALIHRKHAGRVEDAEQHLRTGGAEAPALRFLRSYSNYLTPRANFLSADTLAAVATYLRNLYLNQLLLLLALCVLLLAPRLLVWGIRALADWHHVQADLAALFGCGIGALALGTLFIGFNFGDEPHRTRPFYARQSGVLLLVVVPLTVSAWFIAYGLYAGSAYTRDAPLWLWTAGGALVYGLPWLLGGLAGNLCRRDARPSSVPVRAVLLVGLYTALAGALGGLLLAGVADLMTQVRDLSRVGSKYRGSWPVSALGTALVLGAYSLAVVGHIGLMGRRFSHDAREWWSRLGGLLLLVAVCWVTLFGIVFAAPGFFRWATQQAHDAYIAAGGITWALSTLAGVVLGRSAATAGDGQAPWRDRAAQVVPYVFILGLLGLLALGLHQLLTLPALCPSCVRISPPQHPALLSALLNEAPNFKHIDNRWVFLAFAACLAGTLVLARRLDVNLFSIYYFYRLRLTRCYLGASRGEARAPHPFTGFDPRDDLELAALASTVAEPGRCQRPYPIHNTAMNLVAGKQLAWQERRAAAFALTPLASGYGFALPEGEGEDNRVECYRPTARYMDGVWLGAAVAISGAAASPNMGYHSSPALTFLMTVFNVRLGHWSPNPGHVRTWTRSDPTFGGGYLLRELVGATDHRSPFVYLSDGGHFENLGIYELVRRRCACIVVIDAGQDAERTFEDLGNAIRKCYADFGVTIDLDTATLDHDYHAVGRIHYPDAPTGDFIYIKPHLIGNEPADLVNYRHVHADFPNQSTADQWFDESQFESYRKLGHHIGLAVFGPALATLSQREQTQGAVQTGALLADLCAVLRERQDGALQ